MTTLIKVAACSVNQTPLDWEENLENILAAIRKAESQGAEVIVLPELAITGYGCEKAFSFPDVHKRALEMLFLITKQTTKLIVVGLPISYRKSVYNSAAVCFKGELLGFVAKRNLAGDGNHYENRYFKEWPSEKIGQISLGGKKFPIGDIMFDISGVRIGVEICEDAWVSNRPGRDMAKNAVDLILSPNASHFAFGKLQTRLDFCRDGSRAFHCGIVYANLLGNESGSMIYAGEGIIASGGTVLAQSKRFSFKPVTVTTAIIDIDKNRASQAEQISFNPETGENPRVIEVSGTLTRSRYEVKDNTLCTWESSIDLKHEEFSRAVALGLWDYLRKSKQQGYVVSLSGGADSCSVVMLIRDMVEMALSELGPKLFREALNSVGWINQLKDDSSVEEIMNLLLDTFYQPAEASGKKTLQSAGAVANGVGAKFGVITITSMVSLLKELVEGYTKRELSWDNPEDDLTLQNMPARTRGIIGWTIANAKSKLLIPPGNMSEIMVGYFTQGGDDSGGVNPIGGVRKSYLKKWLEWRERSGPTGLSPAPYLSFVNALAYTAELRPDTEGAPPQTDETELGPYIVRDQMEELFLWDRLSPSEILERLEILYPEYDHNLLKGWVKKFFRLFAINQWKRERLPNTFHVDDHNLSPRNWLRWPTLSGNFTEEISELE
ncbi:MAG TPA: NAD(+) synthase [Oligoflexia bacterium]|nr:NAD(+) synthase [Oligoflexia bacterium]HMP48381.1 NAD(+) synthase [Oligoflexia bacterium]